MTEPTTLARNAEIQDLVAILRSLQPRRYDFVAPASALAVDFGNLIVAGSDAQLLESGVALVDGAYLPTAICDGGLADRLGIPPGYLATCRRDNISVFDDNVNGWLRHERNRDKRFFVRVLRDESGGDSSPLTSGVARAFLSDHFKPIEHLDVLMTVIEGLNAAEVPTDIRRCDLTDRRMYVQFYAPQVWALAPGLLKGYRSPFNGRTAKDLPRVFAGFTVANSEVGHGAYSITPTITVQVCDNGMQLTRQAIRAQHLGGQLPAGDIDWSDDTQAKNLALIEAKTRDAVKAFLSPEWLQRQVEEMERVAGVEVTKPEATIKVVAAELRYTEAQQDAILRMFIKGGSTTAAGVMHAVTAAAQEIQDADVANEMEGHALRAMELAAANAG